MVNINIGKSIKIACAIKGRPQYWLAAEMGVSEQTIVNWSKGKYQPNLLSLHKMASIFEMKLSYFIQLGE